MLCAEVAADASRDVMACVVGVPTATVARYSLARATLLSTTAFPDPDPTPRVPFSSIAILFLAFNSSARGIIPAKRERYSPLKRFLPGGNFHFQQFSQALISNLSPYKKFHSCPVDILAEERSRAAVNAREEYLRCMRQTRLISGHPVFVSREIFHSTARLLARSLIPVYLWPAYRERFLLNLRGRSIYTSAQFREARRVEKAWLYRAARRGKRRDT